MPLIDKLYYLKKKCRLTTDEISEKSGIALGTLNKVFSGATHIPGYKTLNSLSDIFGVPVRYLTDDNVPVHCDIGLYAAGQGLFMISGEELNLLKAYRALPGYDRRFTSLVLNHLKAQAAHEAMRSLLCYVPAAGGQPVASADFITLRRLMVPLNEDTEKADLAVQIAGEALEPGYPSGSVLALKSGQAQHGQLGAFLLNRKGFVRQYYCKRGLRKLVALNTSVKDILLSSTDEIECLGIVQNLLSDYRWT